MPQEFHALKCFNCQMFQVHIVKKIPKWNCKMCGERQSVIKVYGFGTGRECRLIVQQLNENSLRFKENHSEALVSVKQIESQLISKQNKNKWQQFVECKENDLNENSECLVENVLKQKTEFNEFSCESEKNVMKRIEIKQESLNGSSDKTNTNIFENNEDLSSILDF